MKTLNKKSIVLSSIFSISLSAGAFNFNGSISGSQFNGNLSIGSQNQNAYSYMPMYQPMPYYNQSNLIYGYNYCNVCNGSYTMPMYYISPVQNVQNQTSSSSNITEMLKAGYEKIKGIFSSDEEKIEKKEVTKKPQQNKKVEATQSYFNEEEDFDEISFESDDSIKKGLIKKQQDQLKRDQEDRDALNRTTQFVAEARLRRANRVVMPITGMQQGMLINQPLPMNVNYYQAAPTNGLLDVNTFSRTGHN